MSPVPVEPEWLDGPGFVAWLSERGLTSAERQLGVLARRLPDWRRGGAANVFTADKVLTKLGLHLSELPDDLWTSPPQGVAAEEERRVA